MQSTPLVLVTALQHRGMMKIIREQLGSSGVAEIQMIDFDVENNLDLASITANAWKRAKLFVLTGSFGEPLASIETVRGYLKKHGNDNCIIVDDHAQAGDWRHNADRLGPLDVLLISTGQDKLPTGMGGGVLFSHNQEILDGVRELQAVELPLESPASRLLFLLKKIPTFLIYNIAWVNLLVQFAYKIKGISVFEAAINYRKKHSGFVRDRKGYNIYPSSATIWSIAYGVSPTRLNQEDALWRSTSIEKFVFLLAALGADEPEDADAIRKQYFPWLNQFDAEYITAKDRESGIGFIYYHATCPIGSDETAADPNAFCKFMADQGVICLPQQSWDTDIINEFCPNVKPIVDRLVLLPNLILMTDRDIVKLAQLMKEYARMTIPWQKSERLPRLQDIKAKIRSKFISPVKR